MNGYREHRRLVQVERSARVSMEIVADAVRLTSAGVPSGKMYDLVGCSAFGSFRVTNNTNAPDEIETIHAHGGVLTALRYDWDPAGGNQIDVFDGTELSAGDYIIITNGTVGHLRQIETKTASAGAPIALLDLVTTPCTMPTLPSGGFPEGTFVIRAQSTRFFIENSAATGNLPTLMLDPDGVGSNLRAPEPIAQGIEDMQIAVGVDGDDDGTIVEGPSTTDEWYYNVAGDSDPPPLIEDGLSYYDTPRAIRITMVGRTIAESSTKAASGRPAAEDRPAAASDDEFRRRVLSTILEIRNMEGSPP
jgi:hypothetical protein